MFFKKTVKSCLFIIPFLPVAFIAFLIIKYSVNIPNEISWTAYDLLSNILTGTGSMADFFSQQNESRPFVPRLITIALAFLFKGDIAYQSFLTLLMACLISFNIYYICKTTVTRDWQACLVLMIIANFLIFSPAQGHSWTQGKIHMFFPITCITSALAICLSSLSAVSKLFAAMLLSAISTFSYANGMLCWVLIAPSLFFAINNKVRHSKMLMIIYSLGFFATIAFYFMGYEKPKGHPSFTVALSCPSATLNYFINFVGVPLGYFKESVSAIIAGSSMLFLFCGAVFYMLWVNKKNNLWRRSLPWFTIASYSLVAGVLTTAGRVGIVGPGQALSTRYVTHSLYLPVSLIFLGGIIYFHVIERYSNIHKTARSLVIVLISVMIIPYYFAGINGIRWIRINMNSDLFSRTITVFSRPIFEGKKIYIEAYELPSAYKEMLKWILVMDEAGLWSSPLAEDDDVMKIQGQDIHTGTYEINKVSKNSFSVKGYTFLPWRKTAADAILISCKNAKGQQVLFRIIISEQTRFWEYRNKEWQVDFYMNTIPCDLKDIAVWAFDAQTAKAYPLALVLQDTG